jgi:hypothetical protein
VIAKSIRYGVCSNKVMLKKLNGFERTPTTASKPSTGIAFLRTKYQNPWQNEIATAATMHDLNRKAKRVPIRISVLNFWLLAAI